ncbi:MAG: sn-glycerol-3-phosphate ABC transporter ATP-binding protein UgpC [Pirellulales bacterium]|nr:sn-glycerol-3-phosphate ABC transporter ATP-binding protein UgpC [Pirellulales bacterium]
MSRIQLKNLNKSYSGGVHAVRDLNLDIADGELVVLVGPSGCGKSTTLRLIAGLEEATSGEIYLGNRLVNHLPPVERDIAMVFQNYALYPHITVWQNLAFGLKMRRIPKPEIQKRVMETAAILAIESLLDRRPWELSGGQRQRVALGRAIIRRPQVFLFDEPLSNLDAKLRIQMRAEIAHLHHRLETTTIYVTHDQVEAMTLSERIVVLDRGIVQQVDSPLNLYHRPANRLVAGFIGSPSMNFIEGRLTEGIFHSNSCHINMSGFPNGPVILGVRPEDFITDPVGPYFADVTFELVEHMGHETIAYFSRNGTQHVARFAADVSHTPGATIPLYIRPNAWHLFTADDAGKRLNETIRPMNSG